MFIAQSGKTGSVSTQEEVNVEGVPASKDPEGRNTRGGLNLDGGGGGDL